MIERHVGKTYTGLQRIRSREYEGMLLQLCLLLFIWKLNGSSTQHLIMRNKGGWCENRERKERQRVVLCGWWEGREEKSRKKKEDESEEGKGISTESSVKVI
ncbi:hypothetical protein V8G54_005560 [Vigna mungo]|uniref:Uncharacterized protein n=1 Tax=Vigna mungo TaxID=3915 RepID=A0AAQ3NYU9_VIGMU